MTDAGIALPDPPAAQHTLAMPTEPGGPAAATDPAPIPPPPPPPLAAVTPAQQLQYDKTSGVSRRQINLIILLGFLNTFLFAAFICLPNVSPMFKDMWANWQKQREADRKAADLRTKVSACMAYGAPADRVVYAEAPDEAERLLTANTRARVLDNGPRLPPNPNTFANSTFSRVEAALAAIHWSPVVTAGSVDPLADWLTPPPQGSPVRADAPVVFLHSMKTPAGRERLVLITLNAARRFAAPLPALQSPARFEMTHDRMLIAYVMDPAKPLPPIGSTAVSLVEPPESRTAVIVTFSDADATPATKPVVELRPAKPWRILAGQPDSTDASHMTIPYAVGDRAEVIDGRLNDGDRLVLTPRTGRRLKWMSNTSYTWDLRATPTTEPAE